MVRLKAQCCVLLTDCIEIVDMGDEGRYVMSANINNIPSDTLEELKSIDEYNLIDAHHYIGDLASHHEDLANWQAFHAELEQSHEVIRTQYSAHVQEAWKQSGNEDFFTPIYERVALQGRMYEQFCEGAQGYIASKQRMINTTSTHFNLIRNELEKQNIYLTDVANNDPEYFEEARAQAKQTINGLFNDYNQERHSDMDHMENNVTVPKQIVAHLTGENHSSTMNMIDKYNAAGKELPISKEQLQGLGIEHQAGENSSGGQSSGDNQQPSHLHVAGAAHSEGIGAHTSIAHASDTMRHSGLTPPQNPSDSRFSPLNLPRFPGKTSSHSPRIPRTHAIYHDLPRYTEPSDDGDSNILHPMLIDLAHQVIRAAYFDAQNTQVNLGHCAINIMEDPLNNDGLLFFHSSLGMGYMPFGCYTDSRVLNPYFFPASQDWGKKFIGHNRVEVAAVHHARHLMRTHNMQPIAIVTTEPPLAQGEFPILFYDTQKESSAPLPDFSTTRIETLFERTLSDISSCEELLEKPSSDQDYLGRGYRTLAVVTTLLSEYMGEQGKHVCAEFIAITQEAQKHLDNPLWRSHVCGSLRMTGYREAMEAAWDEDSPELIPQIDGEYEITVRDSYRAVLTNALMFEALYLALGSALEHSYVGIPSFREILYPLFLAGLPEDAVNKVTHSIFSQQYAS